VDEILGTHDSGGRPSFGGLVVAVDRGRYRARTAANCSCSWPPRTNSVGALRKRIVSIHHVPVSSWREISDRDAGVVRSVRAEPPDVAELVVGEPDGVEAGADAIAAYPRELFGHRVPARIDP